MTPLNGIFNSSFNASWSASGVNPAFFDFVPDLQDDSYATIGLEGPATLTPGAEDPSLVEDASVEVSVSDYFQTGGASLSVTTLTGASWYVLNTAANALPVDGRWLVAQVTTAGSIRVKSTSKSSHWGWGRIRSKRLSPLTVLEPFPERGHCGRMHRPDACNFNPSATEDDGSCAGIPEGDCDCDGNQFDALGECGGDCAADDNMNGVCDDAELWVARTQRPCNYNPTANVDRRDCRGLPTNFCDCDGTDSRRRQRRHLRRGRSAGL